MVTAISPGDAASPAKMTGANQHALPLQDKRIPGQDVGGQRKRKMHGQK